MSRKRGGGNDSSVSLFAFQDIITSVTGIMTLVVMLLILEILESKAAERDRVQTNVKSEDIVALENKLDALRQAWKREQARREPVPTRVETLLVTPLELARRTDEARIIQNRLATRIHDKRQALEQTRDKLKNAQAFADVITRRIKALKTDIERDADTTRVEAINAKIDALKEEERLNQNRTRFIVPRDESRNAVFAQCSKDGIKVRVSGENRPASTISSGSKNSRLVLRDFSNWLKNRHANKDYIVLLVKPSAAGYALDIANTLQDKGFQYGMEPLEEDRDAVW